MIEIKSSLKSSPLVVWINWFPWRSNSCVVRDVSMKDSGKQSFRKGFVCSYWVLLIHYIAEMLSHGIHKLYKLQQV